MIDSRLPQVDSRSFSLRIPNSSLILMSFMERRDTLRSISELAEESVESGFDPIGRVAILTSEVLEPNVAYRPVKRPSNPCPPNSVANSQENIPEDDQVKNGRNLVPTEWSRPFYSKSKGIKKNSKQFSSSGFNMLLFVDNANLLADYGRE